MTKKTIYNVDFDVSSSLIDHHFISVTKKQIANSHGI